MAKAKLAVVVRERVVEFAGFHRKIKETNLLFSLRVDGGAALCIKTVVL